MLTKKVGCILIDVKILIRIVNITKYNDIFPLFPLQNRNVTVKTLKTIFQRNSSKENFLKFIIKKCNSIVTETSLVPSKKKELPQPTTSISSYVFLHFVLNHSF